MSAFLLILTIGVAPLAVKGSVLRETFEQSIKLQEGETIEAEFLWQTFLRRYNKTYEVDEAYERRNIFEENVRYIKRHNAEAKQGLYAFTLGVNHFADMTHKEFQDVMLMKTSRVRHGMKEPLHSDYELEDVTDTPNTSAQCTKFDWRNNGSVVGPVKNQQECASCWAFAALGAVESQLMITGRNEEMVPLSEQNLIDCSGEFGTKGCDGGFMKDAYRYILFNKGIDKEECYQYEGLNNDACYFQRRCVGARIDDYEYLSGSGIGVLKQGVDTHGPIATVLNVGNTPKKFQFYKGGIFTESHCTASNPNHALLVVGYEQCGNAVRSLIMKNSYGTNWGEQGYVRMHAQNAVRCGILNYASYPVIHH